MALMLLPASPGLLFSRQLRNYFATFGSYLSPPLITPYPPETFPGFYVKRAGLDTLRPFNATPTRLRVLCFVIFLIFIFQFFCFLLFPTRPLLLFRGSRGNASPDSLRRTATLNLRQRSRIRVAHGRLTQPISHFMTEKPRNKVALSSCRCTTPLAP